MFQLHFHALFLTSGVSTKIAILFSTGRVQEEIGFGLFSTSTKHIRQLPATDKVSW